MAYTTLLEISCHSLNSKQSPGGSFSQYLGCSANTEFSRTSKRLSCSFQGLQDYQKYSLRGSYMSTCVLLNLLNKLKCKACRAFYFFFATSLMNLIIQEHDCKILFIIWQITLKYHFLRKKVIFLSLCTQRCYGCHNVS